MSPKQIYTERRREREETYRKYGRIDRLFSVLRGLCIVALVVLWLLSERELLSVMWLLAPVVLFGILAVLHEKIALLQKRFSLAVAFYDRGLARLEDRWLGTGDTGMEFMDDSHPYAKDLDIFGKGSLYERISLARTTYGQHQLADWLLQPSQIEAVCARQEAVKDLSKKLDFREELSLAGHQYTERQNSRHLLNWAARSPVRFSFVFRILAFVLASISVSTALLWAFGYTNSFPFLISLAVSALFASQLRLRVVRALEGIDEATQELKLLAEVLRIIERTKVDAPMLRELTGRLASEGTPPSHSVAALGRLLEFLDWRRNHFFSPIGAVLLWRTQFAFAIDNWRIENAARIPQWLSAVGILEALNSFACLRFERPDLVFPQLPAEGPCLKAEAIGHPLISPARCVLNDVCLDHDVRLLVVSGSNMSGKSTLLRAIGLNTVLALAGAPVFARKMQVSSLNVGASIVIRDSLMQGVSHFYAEILRLRQILELTSGPYPVLFLLDEILHGTNSGDRLAGSQAYVRGLIERGATGLITTHDLALTKIADDPQMHAENIHFVDHIEDGKVVFDYRIYPGVVQKSNALQLMRSVGLEV